MTPHNDAAGPATNRTGHQAPQNDTLSITDGTVHKPVKADAPWQANFRRMAERAATDPDYYAITGSGVQALADDIRAGVA